MNQFAILSVHFGPTLTNNFRLIFVCEAITLSLLQKGKLKSPMHKAFL